MIGSTLGRSVNYYKMHAGEMSATDGSGATIPFAPRSAGVYPGKAGG